MGKTSTEKRRDLGHGFTAVPTYKSANGTGQMCLTSQGYYIRHESGVTMGTSYDVTLWEPTIKEAKDTVQKWRGMWEADFYWSDGRPWGSPGTISFLKRVWGDRPGYTEKKKAQEEAKEKERIERAEREAKERAIRTTAPETLTVLEELLEWARTYTSPRDPYSPHDILVRATSVVKKARGG